MSSSVSQKWHNPRMKIHVLSAEAFPQFPLHSYRRVHRIDLPYTDWKDRSYPDKRIHLLIFPVQEFCQDVLYQQSKFPTQELRLRLHDLHCAFLQAVSRTDSVLTQPSCRFHPNRNLRRILFRKKSDFSQDKLL